MENILVATDLSGRSDRAMDRAALLAQEQKAVLHVVHVIDDDLPATIAKESKKNAEQELRRQIAQGPQFAQVSTRIHIAFGQPWQVIARLAQEHNAGLLVVGVHRNRGFRELFSGTTLHRIARASVTPVLVASDRAIHPYAKVLVGCDFSEGARHAADLTTQLVPDHPMILVHAYHIPFKALTQRTDGPGEMPSQDKKRIEADVHRRLWDFVATLDAPHKATSVMAREGGPVFVLEAEAQNIGADLVSVGTHSKPWILDALLGGTAEELLSYPPCDVLAAPSR